MATKAQKLDATSDAAACRSQPQKAYSADAIEAWACYEPKGSLKPFTYEPRALGEKDVEVKISHCAICYTDIHQIDSGWCPSTYPLVPGHEIVGNVTAIGSGVKKFKVGDRVGIGTQCLSCLRDSCPECSIHCEQYCKTGNVLTYNSKYPDGSLTYGGYAKKIRVHEHFTFHIPENLPSASVAPLFCAGATVYEPLRRLNVGKGHKVAIIGVGGLGHMGLQFASALGAEVTAISRTESKKEIATQLGAKHYIASSNPEALQHAARSFDVILSTDHNTLDITPYLNLLKVHGTFVILGIPESKLSLDISPVVYSGLSIMGSLIASPSRIEEMLKFASEKKIVAHVQEFDVSQLNEAIRGVREGKPRFRYVINIH